MRRFRAGLAGAAILVALPVSFAPPAAATPDDLGVMPGAGVAAGDDLPDLVGVKRRELREAALNEVLAGNARVQRRGASRVVRVGSVTTQAGVEDQYVELAREKTDKVFVILAQFGNVRHPSFPDQDTNSAIPGPARSRVRCTTNFRFQIARGIRAPSGSPTTTRPTIRTCISPRGRASSPSRLTTSASRLVATASTDRCPTG